MTEQDLVQRGCAPAECHDGRCGSPQLREDEPQQAIVTDATDSHRSSPSYTTDENSQQGGATPQHASPSVNFDWMEVGGIIDWTEAPDETFFALDDAIALAPDENNPVPYAIGSHSVLLYPRGIGSGSASRLTYRFDFGHSMIAFAQREAKSRGNYNFYYKIPGTACLVSGAWETRRIIHSMIESMGGCITDEWFRRFDVCLDLPGVDHREKILPAINGNCFIGSALIRENHHVRRESTGVTIRSGQVTLRIYDKVVDVKRRTDGEYILAMMHNRWGGTIPTAATRIELQIRSGWLRQFDEMKDVKGVQNRLADIIEKLVGEGERPFFRLTESPVDFKNNHQSRTPTSREWLAYRDEWLKGFGAPHRPPKRLPRHQITSKKAFALAKGAITSDAARRGEVIQTLEDAKDQLEKMHLSNFATDEDWGRLWETKARKAGTLDSTREFPTDYDDGVGGVPCSV